MSKVMETQGVFLWLQILSQEIIFIMIINGYAHKISNKRKKVDSIGQK